MIENLTAWAKSQGFDPDYDYTSPECEGNEPSDESPSVGQPNRRLSTNFTEAEFRCRGTGRLPDGGMNPRLIDALQSIRDHYGVPVTITSGYRSAEHNRAVGGSPNSQHVHGNAADFAVQGVPAPEVFGYLDTFWPGGLGRYNGHTHIDVRPNRVRW